ncbi:glycosyltransferase family 2 protein [Baekduia soli]|uniref:glycosyltransferase family 2 protein n=1 Tax=Baekduia soli TaxID=496014 RepID=UPI0016523B35|nr:glycosyltransferase family A protein [Baekduia soli]
MTAVIAAYNRADVVERAVRSVLAQPRPPAEVLVVDDASTDATIQRAQAAGATVLRRERNGGAAAARNMGVEAATQPWIAFLDSDDEWLPCHLATLWPLAEDYELVTGASLVKSASSIVTKRSGVARRTELYSPAALVFPDNFVSSGGVLVSRAAVREVGGFDEGLRFAEDFDLWLRVLSRHPGVAVPDPVCIYYRHDGQKTGQVSEARAAQRGLLERYRDQPWWSERAFHRRLALNECERRIAQGHRLSALRLLLSGLVRDPSVHAPVARVLASRRLRSGG